MPAGESSDKNTGGVLQELIALSRGTKLTLVGVLLGVSLVTFLLVDEFVTGPKVRAARTEIIENAYTVRHYNSQSKLHYLEKSDRDSRYITLKHYMPNDDPPETIFKLHPHE